MNFRIVADSGCDLTPQLREKMEIQSVPLSLMLGEQEYVDDAALDMDVFMADMKACTKKIGSAAPSPYAFQAAIESVTNAFVVTISSRLSGSYSSAVIGKAHAEESKEIDAHVFDSKTASAGETLLLLKLHELIVQGLSKERIIAHVGAFIDQMKTYFVLDNYDNLLKNGRLNRITGTIANVLNIKLVMGSDGDGNIALFGKPRGIHQMIERLLSLIKESGRKTDIANMVISHCNNIALAERLAAAVRERFNFKEILIVPSGGISSLYADNRGIIMAF